MKVLPFWSCLPLLVPLLHLSAYGYQADNNGSQRVIFRDFSITLSPASPMSVYQAGQVIQIAETLLENKLKTYEFGINTVYDYAGLLGVKKVTETLNSTVIYVRGGLVAFTSNSTNVPSVNEIEQIAKEAWVPELTEALQLTFDFHNVSNAVYEQIVETTITPTFVSTLSPTDTIDPSAIEDKVIQGVQAPNKGSDNRLPFIAAGAAGAVAMVALAVLLLRKQHRKSYWKESNGDHQFPVDDVEASSVSVDKGYNSKKGIDVGSESGSSLLGRMLAAAGLVNSVRDDCRSTPQSSADSMEYMSDFDSTVTMIEPHIVPVSSRIHDELNRKHPSMKMDVLTLDEPSPAENFPFWKNMMMPFQLAVAPTDVSAATLGKCRTKLWSDVSSEPSDANQKDFAPDDSWDFNDNEDDEDSDVILDPFQPAGPIADGSNLLQNKSKTYRMEPVKPRESAESHDDDI